MSTPVIAATVSATSPILFTEFRDAMHAAILKEMRRFITGVAGEGVADKVLSADLSVLTEVLSGYAASIAVVANANCSVPNIDMSQDQGRYLPTEPLCPHCGNSDLSMDILSGTYNRMADIVVPNELSDKGHFCSECDTECRAEWHPVLDPTQCIEVEAPKVAA